MPEVEEMINLAYLTDAERELIVEVLHRDAELRKNEEQRIRKLKSDLQDTKRKGAKRGSGRDLKKCTGDWFYDHRVNRFSTKQGHELVRSSLKRPAALKKRQTAGEILLRSASEEAPLKALPLVPVPHPRQKPPQPPAADREDPVCAPRIGPPHASKPQSSDADNVDGSSLSSRKTLALSASTTPEPLRRGKVQSSPAGSDVSSGNVSSKADSLSSHGSSSDAAARESACGSLDKAPEEQHVGRSPDTSEGEGMFKKSIRRRNTPVHASALDLREEAEEGVRPAMGHRSRSVPGLDIQDEEDEDIDSLVNLHKKTVSTSRRSSSVTMGSTMSIYSDTGDYDSVDVSGEIVYTVSYDEHTQSLIVFIKECHDLAYGDAARRHCNPYVKCYLLPEKSRQSKRKTAIKRNTTNPVYNETLKYSVGRQQLTNQTLAIAVWHNGRLSRNAFLGEVMVTLDVRDLDSPQEECVVLMAKTASPELASAFAQYKGELVICLKYVTPKKPAKAERLSGKTTLCVAVRRIKKQIPKVCFYAEFLHLVKKAHAVEGGELHVLIKEAKSLVAMKGGATSDTFVKGHLLPANVKSTKRKTPVVKKNHNPHYDHTFVYKELSLGQLRDMCLELTVWDRESVASNEFMGGVRLSTGIGNLTVGKDGVEMDSQGEEVSVWEKMMQFPDSWAEGTLRLRSTMGKTPKKGLQTLFSH
ncbi:synaptotagmin-like protein 4 isoform X3 [Gadus chalcogrammus]|uniref:synaptotagmin-like protein 4 isoform X3 n=1 Tax=Gadus chalcogrammus TaxID=1042646 RepID=UPI0024C4D14A|nr:synaptotagmin-like protein 4 isoform X3 [Gadus chalcogrammus]